MRIEIGGDGEERRRIVRHRPEHNRAVFGDQRIVGVVLERRELQVFPFRRRRAAGLARREARNLGRTGRKRGGCEKGAAEYAEEAFHGNASGAQRVLPSRSVQVVNGRP